VLASVEALGIEAPFDRAPPSINEGDWETYQKFSHDVEHYKTILRIQRARRLQGYSVRLDAAAKEKLRHYLQQIRSTVDTLDVDERKKEALYGRINDLQREIDRDRTRFDAVASLSIAAAGLLGDAIEKSQVRGLLNSLERVFWGAQTEAQQRQLPPPSKPRQIEGPKGERTAAPTQREINARGTGDDDEIPF
jgi:hypothetical protein